MKYPQTQENWKEHIKLLQDKTNALTTNEDNKRSQKEWANYVAKQVQETIVKQARQAQLQGEIGILFSGGIDSTLIAYILQQHQIPFHAINIGFWDEDQKMPEDTIKAKEVQKKLSIPAKNTILSFEQVEKIFQTTIQLFTREQDANVVNVGVGSVEVAGITEIQKKHPQVTQWFSGLGSEEIFAGYHRHSLASNKHEECWKGLKEMFVRDLHREFAIAKHHNITWWTPFLDQQLITLTMRIPIEYKISSQESKIILRDAAQILGIPADIARRPKRAAQYGSRTDKALLKLAKRKGYKYKKDYISYVRNDGK